MTRQNRRRRKQIAGRRSAQPVASKTSHGRPSPLDVHLVVQSLYDRVNLVARPYAAREVSSLVQPIPIEFDRVLSMVSPEDAARMLKDGMTDGLFFSRAVQREPVVAALVSKAAATKGAIVALAQADYGIDAYVLTRTLLENVIVVSWMLAKDLDVEKERIDTFILHYETFTVRFAEVMGKTPDGSPTVPPRARQLSTEVFDDKWMQWAWFTAKPDSKKKLVRLRTMAQEVGLDDMYVRDYFLLSAYVHSAPASVLPGPGSAALSTGNFTIQPEPFVGSESGWASTLSMGISNVLMLHLLSVINDRYDFGLHDDIHAARAVLWASISMPGPGAEPSDDA